MAQLTYEINVDYAKGRLLLSLKGSLDATNAEGVQAELEKTWENKEFKQLVWDVSGLDLMASAGLRVVMTSIMYNRNHKLGKLFMIGAKPNIVSLIKVAAMTSFISFVDTLEDTN